MAENLAVSVEEAEQFRSSFLQCYTKIDTFVANTIEQCIINGYVETISHRRRLIPNILSDNETLRSKAKRQAVNSIIQGSAADIIKLSMVSMDRAIERCSLDASLVLQMHDELMYEVKMSESDHNDDLYKMMSDKPGHSVVVYNFVRLLKRQMENVSRHLNVILPVKVKTGLNWGRMQEYDL